KPIATIVDDESAPTENIHARGIPTVRIYRIFEAHIKDPLLANAMVKNSESMSDRDLCTLALDDFQKGGRGRANAMLVI
ncbi:MAG TPA: hypothetical protein DCX53_09505, partial [Anaerolineae bacterium]|nr:hypothetical protein [Anaerolineae bacterium]